MFRKGKKRGAEVKVAHSAQDWLRAKEVLAREHGLGAGSEVGCKRELRVLFGRGGVVDANSSLQTIFS